MKYQEIVYTITSILFVLLIVKTYLFFSSTSNRTVEKWFYFGQNALYNSRSEKSRRSKLVQNRLTLIILCVALLDLILIGLFEQLK